MIITTAFLTLVYKITFEIIDTILHPISKAKSSIIVKFISLTFKLLLIILIISIAIGIIAISIIGTLLFDLINKLIEKGTKK